ncbi:MAG: hypothetical protein GXY83_19055 [Rhodopirellula sp.]|nr:hypothetical protein [Rhodopirellula sp.]
MLLRQSLTGVATALGLLLAAAVTQRFQLWSFLGNLTIPWFCSVTGIAMLLVTMTSSLFGRTVAEVPRSRVVAIVGGSALVVGLGISVDALSYATPQDWTASIGEAIAFPLVLAVLFWIPRVKPAERHGEDFVPDADTR